MKSPVYPDPSVPSAPDLHEPADPNAKRPQSLRMKIRARVGLAVQTDLRAGKRVDSDGCGQE